jgi:hypothetical protein
MEELETMQRVVRGAQEALLELRADLAKLRELAQKVAQERHPRVRASLQGHLEDRLVWTGLEERLERMWALLITMEVYVERLGERGT